MYFSNEIGIRIVFTGGEGGGGVLPNHTHDPTFRQNWATLQWLS